VDLRTTPLPGWHGALPPPLDGNEQTFTTPLKRAPNLLHPVLGNRQATVSVSIVLIVSLSATGGALAEEIEDPTGTACVGVEDEAECEQLAVASDGDAESDVLAVSGTGDADATVVAGTGTGDADGTGVGLSGTGNATAVFLAASGTGDAETERLRIAAVSGTGNTSAEVVEVNGMNDADGCVAVSGTGNADADCGSPAGPAAVSGCEAGQEIDRPEACRDPDERVEAANAAACDTELATADGDGHAWCGVQIGGCVQVIYGAAAGPVFVGGYNGCQVGVFYDDNGHDDAPLP
jgi:hypothetical protein